jgi:hypothetical protein
MLAGTNKPFIENQTRLLTLILGRNIVSHRRKKGKAHNERERAKSISDSSKE